jgi:hypothetical protein
VQRRVVALRHRPQPAQAAREPTQPLTEERHRKPITTIGTPSSSSAAARRPHRRSFVPQTGRPRQRRFRETLRPDRQRCGAHPPRLSRRPAPAGEGLT